ncbi:hydrogenase 4 subunit B [Trinickia caryophylli]|uniref:Formate hydrogenlyase subunit 3/Multisubunit Na+/H+ antiporter, MnhD subunit n=1 Tax=Trinickia caryophylli TaxID=28094 RepID=A0A1X7DC66_TRICW|nr:hydrogenase 4 subunit B [Trinickia caryophylli]PMS09748.1 hydrogenase 4 subunit B [Trinickia caryophylli]TRX16809.1 hydrogenase 4 subunit B [Trinickia caryophylli]WQE12465.1 hydrogenase 4 subunit B [Trinickia caryophylli]SMF12741.1 Formate hydrogenlyase subunit 3/Multisubunit Na+/H+ antiporter, MnhD subunit [Trinickia caryophylli]GLU31384.1 hydrogenase 4 subunit B [Trinickia caryophylli]
MASVPVVHLVLLVVAAWLVIGTLGFGVLHRTRLVAHGLFPLGALGGLLLGAAGLAGLFAEPSTAVLPIGLPGLPFHLRVDRLSGYFLFVLGLVSTGIGAFSAGYFRKGEGAAPGLICFEYHVCLASIALVLVADDAYVFMVAWEALTLSATFLVMTNHRIGEIRRAGYLYFLISHVGALALLLCFGTLQARTGDYTFANMRAQSLDAFRASLAFLFALVGFGAKAGIFPLHVWLPEAHPAAPSPVSALLSGFVLKVGLYGLLRTLFDLLHLQIAWWGVVLLVVGIGTALLGVVFSTIQVDMKRLLAYSSIDNIGLMVAALGLAVLFNVYGMSSLSALAMTAMLYQIVAHAAFKSLLFLGTGAVLHATGQRNLGRLGGLIRFMPWTAWAVLAGVAASAGLPPLSGFVAEWLLLQSFLFTPGMPDSVLAMTVPIVAALVAMSAALAGYTMVKFFGIVFLGQPREAKLNRARDANGWERFAFCWFAAASVLLGLMPAQFVKLLDRVTRALVGAGIGADNHGWLLFVPVSTARASYMPVVFMLFFIACCGLAWVTVRRLYHGRLRRAAPWSCGFPFTSARMQDTAEGFGQPIREIFTPLLRIERQLPSPFDAQPSYRMSVTDRTWSALYAPVAALTQRVADWAGRLQTGRIAVYLTYSFVVLIMLLMLVRRW